MKSAKEILQSIKDIFNAPAVITPVVPAEAAAPAPAAPAPKTYKTSDGVEISIAQAGEIPAVGDSVMVSGVPATEGVLTLEDGSTVAVGPDGKITAYTPAAPVTNDLSTAPQAAPVVAAPAPVAQFEEQFAAQRSAFEKEVSELRDKIAAQDAVIAKYDATIQGMFDLCEVLTKEPSTVPVTLTGSKKDQFTSKKEERIGKIASALSEIRKNK